METKLANTKQAGFTMLELMIVIVIIGVLMSIAIPAYTSSVQKSRRTDAKNALLDLATREEKFYSVNNKYTQTATDLYGGTVTFPMNVQTGGTAYYQVDVPTLTAAGTTTSAYFQATATPVAPQDTDACGTFNLDSLGAQGAATTNCW